MHDQDMRGQGHKEFHVVLDDDENDLPFGEDTEEQLAKDIEQRRIDARGGLVEQQQAGPRD